MTYWCLCLAFLSIDEVDWPEFRAHDGVSKNNGLPLVWGESEHVRWKTPIHGKGWSSPVIWKKRIWLTTAPVDGKQLFAVCIDLDSGEIVRDVKVFDVEKPAFCHPTNSYASCTPVVEEGRVYVHFGAYGTACLDSTTGEKLWERREFSCDHFRGPASSPIVDGDLLFLTFDGVDLQYVVALDKRTGKTVWKRDREIDYGTDVGDRKKAYGTPTVITQGGRKMLVSPTAAATIAYDPADGKELWRVRHGGMNVGARPIYANGLVYIRAGSDADSLIALRPEGSGDLTDKIVWRTGKNVPLYSSPLVVGELLFLANDGGVVSCLDAKTGNAYWRQRFPGSFWASPLSAEGRIYLCTKDGFMPVVAAKKEYALLAENKLSDGCNASPAIAGKALYVRTKTHLYRIEN